MLIDFGFDRERSSLALKLSGNIIDGAVELLTADEGSDLASLYNKVQEREQATLRQNSVSNESSMMNDFFAGLSAPTGVGGNMPVPAPRERHELECKMTIVVRADAASGITGGGTSAKLVSLAVIKAYERAREFDPVALNQWEANSWTKICLKVKSDSEIRDIAKKATEVGVNCFLLERNVTRKRKVLKIEP